MLCSKIISVLEASFPTAYALSWDNVGLLAGRADKEIQKIYVALDATDEVIEEAVRERADMILTHHPLIFSPMKRITDQDFIGRRIVKLLQHDISYYAMHTNYDVLRMAELTAGMLELQNAEVLEVTAEVPSVQGIGRVGDLSSVMMVDALCERVKEVFGVPQIKVFGDLKRQVHRAAIAPGSGKSVIGTAIDKEAEVLITGDIDHHDGIDAVARGLVILDAGHYGIEHIYIRDMEQFLQKHFPDIQTVTAGIQHPFQVV